MPPRNKVFDLPPEVREQLNEKLVSSGFQGYEALAGWLRERGYNVSKSSVHRYGQDLEEEFEEAMGDVKKTTALAKAMVADQDDESGSLLDATARITQDHLLRILIALRNAEHEPEKAAKHIATVTKAMADIGRVSLSQKKWAKELRVEVAKEAAEKAETSMATQGMSREAIDSIKRDILGIA